MTEEVKEFATGGLLRNAEAVIHWFGKTAEPRKVHVSEYASDVKPDDFQAIRKARADLKGRNAEVVIHDTLQYRVPSHNSNNYVLGNTRLETFGILHSKKDGTQFYQGIGDKTYRIQGAIDSFQDGKRIFQGRIDTIGSPDIYNFPKGDRGFPKEELTTFGRIFGKPFGAKTYPIIIEGSMPLLKTYSEQD